MSPINKLSSTCVRFINLLIITKGIEANETRINFENNEEFRDKIFILTFIFYSLIEFYIKLKKIIIEKLKILKIATLELRLKLWQKELNMF